MSTRSCICRLQEDGKTYDIRYIHSDGYVDGVGHDLVTYYTDPTKVQALFALGDLSALYPEIGEAHNAFPSDGNPKMAGLPSREQAENWTKAYHRDRGEALQLSTTPARNLRKFAYDNYGAEYVYIWQPEERTWKGYSVSSNRLSPVKIPA